MQHQTVEILAFYAQKWKEYRMAPHLHTHMEFMCVLQGEAQVCLYDKQGVAQRCYTLHRGELIWLAAGTRHQLHIQSDKPCHIVNLEYQPCQNKTALFGTDSEEERFFERQAQDHCVVFDQSGRLGRYFLQLTEELEQQKNGDFTSYAIPLFWVTWKEFLRSHYIQKSDRFLQFDYLHAIDRYLKERFTESITLDDIATHLALNKSYIQKIYHEQTGTTIGNQLTRYRMERACLLLSSSNMGMMDIALAVGYESRQGFFNAFKQRYHMTPKQYRAAQKER